MKNHGNSFNSFKYRRRRVFNIKINNNKNVLTTMVHNNKKTSCIINNDDAIKIALRSYISLKAIEIIPRIAFALVIIIAAITLRHIYSAACSMNIILRKNNYNRPVNNNNNRSNKNKTKCRSEQNSIASLALSVAAAAAPRHSTNQADFVFFATAFAASVVNAGATSFSSYPHDNSSSSSFSNYDDGLNGSFATEKDVINPSVLPTQLMTPLNETDTVTGRTVNVVVANGTSATAASGSDDWAHFQDLVLSWQGICLIAVFCTFIVITIIGNTLVILAVITTRRLKTVTNCFVMSLAVADLLVGIFVMPPAVAVHLIGSWQLGWILCDIWISLDVLLCTASILSLCAISVDRYLAVTQPLNYSRKRRSKRLALIMILIVWILALAITCPPMLGWYEPGRRDLKECRYNQNEGYVIFSAMGSFFIPMSVMIYVYARISCVIASRHDHMTDISVHNKKFKRYTSNDVDNEMDPYTSEHELTSSQKKQMAVRTFSNQTIVKELHEVMLSDGSDNTATKTTYCHSLLALPTGNTKNGCYELTRPASLRRSPTPTATSGCGGTLSSTGLSSLGESDTRMMDHQWSYGGSSSGSIARTQSVRHQQHQSIQPNQHHHQLHEHRLSPASGNINIGASGLLTVTPTQHQNESNMTTAAATAATPSTQFRQTRIYQPQQHHHHHHHPPHHHHNHPHHTKSFSNRITSLKKENKTTQTLSIVVGGFIACWLPFFVYYLLTPFLEEHQVSQTLAKVLTWLGWFNSAINPFIYAFYSVDFRAAFWRLTCKRFFSSPTRPQFPSNTMSIRR